MMRLRLSIFLLIFHVCLCSGAYSRKYTLEKVDASADLSHSAVLSIYQDRQGTIWFGTYDGLNSYDGKNIKTFRSDFPESTGLTNNVIMTVCQADDNCVWCATDYVLNKFSLETYTTQIYDFRELYTVHSNDSGNTFLIRKDSLYYYNTTEKNFIPISSGFTSEGGTSMYRKTYVSSTGEFWYFNSENGEVRISSVSSFSASPDQVRATEYNYRFHTKGIKDVFCQSGVIAFVDVDDDLFLYDTDNRSKVYIRNISSLISRYGNIRGISPFYEDVYIGFAVNGLVRLNMHDGYKEQEVDRNMRIYGMFFDNSQGILWIATDGQGAICYKSESSIAKSVMLNHISSRLSRQVRSIITDSKENLWLGTKGDGIVRIPEYHSATSFTDVEVLLPEGRLPIKEYKRGSREFQVYSLNASKNLDGFWVGTGSDGLYFYSCDADRLHKPRGLDGYDLSEIHSIVEVGDSILYVASARDGLHKLSVEGLSVSRAEKIRFINNGHEVEMFYPMTVQGDSLLWLGSRTDGVVRYDLYSEDYSVISLTSLVGRSADDVLSLCVAADGTLHVGTTSGLVSLISQENSLTANYIGHEDGLLNDMVHGILEDENGVLWLSTNKGMAKYNPVSGMVHNYYYTSGVEIAEFSDDAYYKNKDTGEMFFGGVNGYLMLKDNAFSHSEVERDLVLRDMTLNGKEVRLSDYYRYDRKGNRSICLKGPQVSFSFFYSVPDFLSGRDIEYSYKLEGFSEAWSVFYGSNEAFFTSVPSGRYNLLVRYKKDVFDNDYKTYSVPVRVLAPWYACPVAIIIYTIIVLIVLVLAARLFRRADARRKMAKRKVGIVSATEQDIMDVLAVIYNSCERIEHENDPIKRTAELDIIRDSLSGILGSDAQLEMSPMLFPQKYVVSLNERISDVSDEVFEIIKKEGEDISKIDVTVLQYMCYPIYRNAFRRILHMLYRGLAESGKECKVVFEKTEKHWLQITANAPWEILWVLYEAIDNAFGRFAKQTDASISCVDKGRHSQMIISFPPAVTGTGSYEEISKKIVLLANPSDLVWLICDQLSSAYEVIVEDSAKKAFELLHDQHVVLFMVDMRLFEGKEGTILDYLNQNNIALSKLSFLPMFTWNTDQAVCRELILHSDAYMMLPYDIQMLQNIVHKAIFGKTLVANVQVHDILKNAGSINDDEVDFLKSVIDIIDMYLDREVLGSTFIAEKLAMSSSSFYRRFKRIAKVTPEMLIKNYRLEKAARLLKDTGASISDVIFDVGISSRSYFYKEFSKKYGMTPKEYKDKYCSDLTL